LSREGLSKEIVIQIAPPKPRRGKKKKKIAGYEERRFIGKGREGLRRGQYDEDTDQEVLISHGLQ